ncbi:MAG TPA: hypothetical protein VGN13_09015 [Solirubrobacteraceae bacterium]|jgi:hypothetical protein
MPDADGAAVEVDLDSGAAVDVVGAAALEDVAGVAALEDVAGAVALEELGEPELPHPPATRAARIAASATGARTVRYPSLLEVIDFMVVLPVVPVRLTRQGARRDEAGARLVV